MSAPIDLDAAKEARKARRAFASSPVSTFVRKMRDVIALYLRARSEGVSREDGIRGVEEELRAAWPKSVSKFKPACDECDDTGWREMVCWDRQRCGRKVCAANPEKQHGYVVPCECPSGDRMRSRTRSTDDALVSVGKTQKKRSFSRFGS